MNGETCSTSKKIQKPGRKWRQFRRKWFLPAGMKIPLRIRVYKRVRLTVVTRIGRSWKKMVLTRGRIQNFVKHLRQSVLRKYLKSKSQ